MVAALAERLRGLQPRRPRADDEDLGVGAPGPHPLRMPAAPPLLPHRRVLGAPDRDVEEIACDADVAADALADVLQAPLLDLQREKRVRDRRSGRADQVEDAVAHEAHHRVRRGQPPHRDHGLRRQLLQAAQVVLLPGLGAEAGGERVVLPVADHEVPEVRQLADETEHLGDLAALEPARAGQLVDHDAARDGGAAVHLVEGVLEDLAEETGAVLEAAAVLVVPVVRPRREEVLERRQAVRGVDVDEVVPRPDRARHGLAVPAPEIGDVLSAHLPGLHGIPAAHRQVRRAERHGARVVVRSRDSAVDELDPGQRPMRVHLLDQPRVGRDVGVVPDPSLDEAPDVGRMVELDLLGADDRPAALGLDPAHHRVGGRVAVPHPVAVRHLEEPVARRHRADPDRLEQDVETRLAGAHEACRTRIASGGRCTVTGAPSTRPTGGSPSLGIVAFRSSPPTSRTWSS